MQIHLQQKKAKRVSFELDVKTGSEVGSLKTIEFNNQNDFIKFKIKDTFITFIQINFKPNT